MLSRSHLWRAAGPLLGQTRCRNIPAPITTSLASKRYLVGDTGDNKSGHITTTPQEGILFFSNLLPPNLHGLFRIGSSLSIPFYKRKTPNILDPSTSSFGAVNPAAVFENAAKESQLENAAVVEILPRYSEGGAFLKFSHDGRNNAQAIDRAVRKYLKENTARPWWQPFSTVRARLVLGKPWLEDLARRPSSRLRVEFLPTEPGETAAELNQEQLYSFFRPFGKLSEIVAQPSDSKVLPKYAYLDFAQHRKAIMAKNCMHGYTVSDAEGGGKLGTVLRLQYERRQRFGWFKDWMVNHPRIVIPLLAALVAGISYAVFDPLRTLSIKAHVTRVFHLEENVVFAWFIRQGEDLVAKVKSFARDGLQSDAGMQVVWEDRQSEIEQIQAWLMETTDTFIVVQGPRGSGKRELVIEHALKHKREAHKVLTLDCKPLQEARGDASTIAAAADQVGYRPVFSWMNNISGLMDLAAQGLTGTKAGFSETLDSQLSKIWAKTSQALKSIALDGRRKDDRDYKLSADEYLEAHPELRPVVVIDNFLHKSSEQGAALVYDKLAEWAATLTSSNIAHVIFLTNDVSFSKSLSKALPDRVFRQISLGDCSPEVAKRYVIQHLDFDAHPAKTRGDDGDDDSIQLTPSQQRKDLQELDDVIGQLGGRLTDLEFFARRIKAGETPTKAVKEIVDQSASEILKMYLLLGSDSREWTSAQAWTLVRDLAAHGTLRYNEILLSTAFSAAGSEKAIAALEQAELISVQSFNGRPYSVKPGKPVYHPAFQRLVEDKVLRAKLELGLLGEAIAGENKSIDKYEQELHLISELKKQPAELYGRMQWLLAKIAASQKKIEGLEQESATMKVVLTTEY